LDSSYYSSQKRKWITLLFAHGRDVLSDCWVDKKAQQIRSRRVAGNINECLGLDDVAERNIGFDDSFFASSDRFAQRLSVSTEDLRETTTGLSQTNIS
jgi:hypothetical protein